jgi:hypothetical protein
VDATVGVERRVTVWTAVVAVEIGCGCQSRSTLPAQNCGFVERVGRNPLALVVGDGDVAVKTRIVAVTARESDSNDIPVGIVVYTARRGIDVDAPKRNRKAPVGFG